LYATDLGVSNENNPERYDHRELNVAEVELGHGVSDAFLALRRAPTTIVLVVVSAPRVTAVAVRVVGGGVVMVVCDVVAAVRGVPLMTVRRNYVVRQVRRRLRSLRRCRRRGPRTGGADVRDDGAAARRTQQTTADDDDDDDDDRRSSAGDERATRHDREPTDDCNVSMQDTTDDGRLS